MLYAIANTVAGIRVCRGEPLSKDIRDLRPTIVLAADCVYYEPAFPLLLKTLADFLELSPSTTIYFSFKKRRRADTQFLSKAMRMFKVTEVDDDERDVFRRENIFLYTIESKARPLS